MTEQNQYARHPLSVAFGTMDEAERAELKASVKRDPSGVRILMHENMILDGWHRYRCLLALGIDPDKYICEFPDSDDPVEYVLKANDWRRHVPKLERCKTRVRLYRWRAANGGAAVPSIRTIAEEMGVSTTTVLDAINAVDGKPYRKDDPEKRGGGKSTTQKPARKERKEGEVSKEEEEAFKQRCRAEKAERDRERAERETKEAKEKLRQTERRLAELERCAECGRMREAG